MYLCHYLTNYARLKYSRQTLEHNYSFLKAYCIFAEVVQQTSIYMYGCHLPKKKLVNNNGLDSSTSTTTVCFSFHFKKVDCL